MTWSAKATVEAAHLQDVYSDWEEEMGVAEPHPTGAKQVRITAVAKDDAIHSNTEGTIKHISINFVIDGAKSQLAVGDEINISGHFGSYSTQS